MYSIYPRAARVWAIASAVCLLAPLCQRPLYASGPTLMLGQKRATVALGMPIVSPLRTVHVGQHPASLLVIKLLSSLYCRPHHPLS